MEAKLSTRQRKILLVLSHESDFKSAKYFSTLLNVSVKTLMREVKYINTVWILDKNQERLILTEKGKGCKLNKIYQFEINSTKFNENVLPIPDVQEDRITWILHHISICALSNKSFLLNDLCELLYISLTTIKKDLKIIKEKLNLRGLILIKDGNLGLLLAGPEKNIRKFIVDYAFYNITNTKINMIYSSSLDRMQLISSLILSVLKKHNIRITDLSYHNLVIHIEVLLQRMEIYSKTEYIESLTYYETMSIEYLASKEICNKLSEQLNKKISNVEVLNLYFHLICQKRILDFHSGDLFEYHNKKNLNVIYESLTEIEHLYNICFINDDVLVHGLYIHLECAIKRMRYGVCIENELIDQILSQYPFEVQLATILSQKIESNLEKKVHLNEIGFLALHFCGAMERINEQRKKDIKNVIITCGSSNATSILLKEKLKAHFGDNLNICKTVALYELKINAQDYINIDAVISTVKIPFNLLCKIIYISPITSNSEIKNIETVLFEKEADLTLIDFMREDLFFNKAPLQNKEEIIDMLVYNIRKNKLADEKCISSIYEREKVGATEIGNLVAIPHSMFGTIYQSTIITVILEQPVKWEQTYVQLIFLLLVDRHSYRYDKLFVKLFQHINDDYEINKIIQNGTYDYLKTILI